MSAVQFQPAGATINGIAALAKYGGVTNTSTGSGVLQVAAFNAGNAGRPGKGGQWLCGNYTATTTVPVDGPCLAIQQGSLPIPTSLTREYCSSIRATEICISSAATASSVNSRPRHRSGCHRSSLGRWEDGS